VPPPDPGLLKVTPTVVGETRSLEEILAVNALALVQEVGAVVSLAFTQFVVNAVPFHWIATPSSKFDP
jgi:hypothetical protein